MKRAIIFFSELMFTSSIIIAQQVHFDPESGFETMQTATEETGSYANDIISRQNIQAMKMMGFNPPLSPPSDPVASHKFILEQYNRSNKDNSNAELARILNETQNSEPSVSEYWNSPDFTGQTRSYYPALAHLKEMIIGKRPLSVKDAFYEIETAEGDNYFNKKGYDSVIKKSVGFIKQWMLENKLDMTNNIALHFAIQKFMTDTLTIGKKTNPDFPDKPETMHFPFYYDYQDYKVEKDNRSYHVMKTFATGNGQCHTLPIVYCILAEALGTKFYLSYAPIHDFIKYPDNKGNIHNFEATSNWQISDQWYKDNLFVKSLAQKNQIYLNQLDRKQIVAGAVIDLAYSYMRKFGVADGKFINQCVDFAMNYFPNKEANIYGWLLRDKVTTVKLDRIVVQRKIKTNEDMEKNPDAVKLLNQLRAVNQKIESLGYEEIPESVYDEMVQGQDSKGKIQQLKKIDNLKKHDLFVTTKPK